MLNLINNNDKVKVTAACWICGSQPCQNSCSAGSPCNSQSCGTSSSSHLRK